MNKNKLSLLLLISFITFSCVERGKPLKKEEATSTTTAKKKNIDHYTCPNGHKGSDKQGKCTECSTVLVHNQAFHGNNLAIPKATLDDPFANSSAAQNAPSPAQNAYGVYHYTCPNGHPGGSGSAENCTACDAKLVHNQAYHQ